MDEEAVRLGQALPDLSAVLSEPLLRHVFGIYLLSCFVPEHMAFRDDVERYVALFDRPQLSLRGLQERRSFFPQVLFLSRAHSRLFSLTTGAVAEEIVKRFCRSDSLQEIVVQGRTRARLKERMAAAVLERDLFSEALAESDTSMAACLPGFLRSEVYGLVQQKKNMCERLFAKRTAAGAAEGAAGGGEEEDESDDSDEQRGGCGCIGRRRARGAGEAERQQWQVEGETDTLSRAELLLLWRYGVAAPQLRVRRAVADARWVALSRCSVSDAPRIQPVDPTLVIVPD